MKDLEDRFTEGQFAFMDEDFDGSIRIFSEILEEDAGFAKAWQARAIAYLRKGETELALKDIEEAVRLEPENARFHFHKGAILFQREELDLAVESLSKAIDLDPTYAAPYLLRGQIYEKLGDEESASADLSRAMALRREDVKSRKVVDF